MNLIRRSAWVAVLAGAVAGCGGEEESTAPSNTPPPGPAMAPPKPAEPVKTAPAKEEAPKETPPATKPGDGKKPEESPKLEGPKAEGAKGDTAAAKLTSDEIAAIKQLPAADQALALKQVVCPVSDEHLGEMGKPFKMTLEGRTVFLCCENCEKDAKADSKKTLAKLDGAASKK